MRDSPIRNENEKDPESKEEIQEIEPEEITSHDALIFIDKLINLKELNDTERSTLSSLKDRLEKLSAIKWVSTLIDYMMLI